MVQVEIGASVPSHTHHFAKNLFKFGVLFAITRLVEREEKEPFAALCRMVVYNHSISA